LFACKDRHIYLLTLLKTFLQGIFFKIFCHCCSKIVF
jgi:hypothetical protein